MNIPKGYKLVPVEPTEEMLDAFCGTKFYILPVSKQLHENQAYAQMLAAAPTPAQPIYDEEVVAWEVTGGGVKPGVFTFKPGWAVDDPAYTVLELVYAQSRAKAVEVGHE